MQIACCQLDIAWENKPVNFARVQTLIADALRAGRLQPGGILLLPEMFATGFSMDVGKSAERANGETTQFLKVLAAFTGNVVIGGVVSTGPDGKGLNRALAMAPTGQVLADYSKMHPFTPGDESTHFAAGDRVVTFEHGGVKVGLAVCYDLRFPELFRALARQGAELLIDIANWPAPRIAHWRALLIARAIENQCCVAGCNRTGSDPKSQYPGNSLIVDHGGQVLAEGGVAEEIITAEIDAQSMRSYRQKLPFLKDMRNAAAFHG